MLFDHIRAIFEIQTLDYYDKLDVSEKKTVEPFMINRVISQNPHYLPFVNKIQQYGPLEPREAYLFYSQLLPHGRQFTKYIKATKSETYEQWLIDLVALHYKISKVEAIDYLQLFCYTEAGKEDLRLLCLGYGKEL
jgi:hypothetical protein